MTKPVMQRQQKQEDNDPKQQTEDIKNMQNCQRYLQAEHSNKQQQ